VTELLGNRRRSEADKGIGDPQADLAPFNWRRMVPCILAAAMFSGLSACLLRGGGSKHVIALLPLQYLVLLPAVVYALRQTAAHGNVGKPALPPQAALLAFFLIPALGASWWESQGLLISDESAYQFQAGTFVSGHITAAAPPGAQGAVEQTPQPLYFEQHILDGGRWFTKYPPGWPLILAVALWLGAGWAANPLLGLALLLLTAALAHRLYDRRTAVLAVFLAVFSPFFIGNCVWRMSHPACGVLLAAACLCCFRGLETQRSAPFVWMFLLILGAFQVRPFSGAVVGGTLSLATLWYLRRRPLFPKVLAWGAGFGILTLVSALIYNKIYTGSFWLSPYVFFLRNPLTAANNEPDIDLNLIHMAHQLLHQTRWAVQNTVFFTFPFVFLLAGYAVWREKKHPREVRILAVVFAVLVLAHVVQPSVSLDVDRVGERYYFEGLFAVLVLGARGLLLLLKEWRPPARAVTLVLAVLALVETGQEAISASVLWTASEPYRQVHQAAENLGRKPSAIFLKSAGPEFVAKHFNLNQPDWKRHPLFFFVDPGPAQRAVWACRVGRRDWAVITYDAVKHAAAEEFGTAPACAGAP
jgi:hypothetical protein